MLRPQQKRWTAPFSVIFPGESALSDLFLLARLKLTMNVASLFVLVCVAQAALGLDFDCSTETGQLAFLQNGATTNPNCYTPVVNLVVLGTIPTAAQIQVVSDALAQPVASYLAIELTFCRSAKRTARVKCLSSSGSVQTTNWPTTTPISYGKNCAPTRATNLRLPASWRTIRKSK